MRRGGIGIAAALAAMAAAGGASARPTAFDLQCGETRYRIDLRTKAWCRDACEERRRLHGVQGRIVTLSLFDHVSVTYDMRRRTMTDGFDLLGTEGRDVSRCRVLKFSGLPPERPDTPNGR